MSLRLERYIKLSCGDSHDIDGVLHSLVTFLEEFKELDVQEPIVLNLDVSEMPLLLDIQHMRNLVSMLATYGECVRKVSLLNITPDVPGQTYFARQRKKFNINGFVSGVVQGSADESTSVSMVVQDAAKAFTLANIQQMKTVYGRQYLALAQSYGPATWGIT